jgi:3-phenylpropionate/trans-cinnamate dioxygenase ferredoxin component
MRWDHADRTYALFRSEDDKYVATDGLCTHESLHLADGLLQGFLIECLKHKGRNPHF